MDPYRDVIPDDEGEEIRKRVRERDGSDDEARPSKRPRANTSTLLSPTPEGDQQDIQVPPKPEDDLDKYDRARLQQGLRYIDGAGKRKIIPRTQEFLNLHRDAYKVALGETSDKSSRAVVQALDKVYYGKAFYFKPRPPEEHERLTSYVKLRQLELLANYGDYLGHEASLFRADLKEAAASGVHSANLDIQAASRGLSGPRTWTDIADELASADVAGLRKNIYGACAALGIDPQHMMWLIDQWAQRNRVFHNAIRQHISECDWHAVATQLCRDLKELLNVAGDKDTAAQYEKVLLKIRGDYFNVVDPDDTKYWFANEKAMKLSQERLAKEKKKAEKK